MIGVGINLPQLAVRPHNYDADAASYFARAGTLTAGRKALINNLIVGIKADLNIASFATAFDCFWILANETSAAAYKNLAKDDHHCSEVGTGTFTADQGYAGNGSTGYLNTDYIPSTDAVAVVLNAHHVSAYNRTNRGGTASMYTVATRQAAPSAREISIAPNSGGSLFMRNAEAAASIAVAADKRGYYVGVRNTATTGQRYLNAVARTSNSTTSVGLPNVAAFIGARNNAGTPDQFSTDQTALVSFGQVLTAAQVTALTARVETYMDAIGAGVI